MRAIERDDDIAGEGRGEMSAREEGRREEGEEREVRIRGNLRRRVRSCGRLGA